MVFVISRAQPNLSNAIKFKLADTNYTHSTATFLVKGSSTVLKSLEQRGELRINYQSGDIYNIMCPFQTIAKLAADKSIIYADFISGKRQILNDTMLVRNRVVAVKAGQSPLMQAYDGTGIVIGFIDTGIDFNHPDFKDAQGKTRIRFIWDQVPTSGSSVPSPFNYGIEWTDAQIDANLCTHNDLPNFGHGTHVAGIGAGNGKGNGTHTGVASGADIIAVAIDFNKQGSTTLDAVKYILAKAAQLGKPCVINASIGDYYGSHDATDLESIAIENLVSNHPGVVLVAAAGNAGGVRFHTKSQPAGDTTFTWLKNSSNSLDYWTYADTNQIKNVQFSVGANRVNFSDAGRIPFFNYGYGLQSIKTDTLFNANHKRLGIIKTSASINTKGVYELYVNIAADTSNLYWRIESKGNGLHHAWNFDFVSANLPNATTYPFIAKYTSPDSLLSMVSGFQCSDEIITVANYNNTRYFYDVNNVLQDDGLTVGEISGGSSLGPTRDGRQKPDVAASGQMVFSTIPLSMLPNLIANAPSVVAQGSLHVRGGGTSASSPVVAGVAALYFQKNPSATNRDFKKAVTECAYSDQFTGSSLPDHQWGFGKIDAKNTLLCHENLVGLTAMSSEGAELFPNPFSETLKIKLTKSFSKARITVYSVDGRTIYSTMFSGESFEVKKENLGNYSGLLLLKIESENSSTAFKVIKE